MPKIVTVLCLCLFTCVLPCRADTGLSAAQTAKLKTFGPTVVVAGYIPPGFKLSKVTVEIDKRFGNSYEVQYQGPGKADFTIQGAYGGIGGGPEGTPLAFNSPLLGKGELVWIKPGGPGGRDDGRSSVWSGWLKFPGHEFPVFALTGSNMDAKVGAKIVESFQLLK